MKSASKSGSVCRQEDTDGYKQLQCMLLTEHHSWGGGDSLCGPIFNHTAPGNSQCHKICHVLASTLWAASMCKLRTHLKLEGLVHEVSSPTEPQSTIVPAMSDTQNHMPTDTQHSGTSD